MSWSYASDTRQTGFSDIRQNPYHFREHSELLRSGRKIRSRIDFALHGVGVPIRITMLQRKSETRLLHQRVAETALNTGQPAL